MVLLKKKIIELLLFCSWENDRASRAKYGQTGQASKNH